jgi:hypothetical protein
MNAFCHTVQNFLSSRILFEITMIDVQATVTLRVVLYACETCSLALREEHRLRIFGNIELRKIL